MITTALARLAFYNNIYYIVYEKSYMKNPSIATVIGVKIDDPLNEVEYHNRHKRHACSAVAVKCLVALL
jgi:hypothetical protein